MRKPDRLVVSMDDDGVVRVRNTGPRMVTIYFSVALSLRLRPGLVIRLHPRTAQEMADGVEKPWGLE